MRKFDCELVSAPTPLCALNRPGLNATNVFKAQVDRPVWCRVSGRLVGFIYVN